MKINPKYGERIITIPAGAVLEYLPNANESELKVLIFTLANQNVTLEVIEKGTGLNKEQITSALFKWKDLGVISCIGLKGKKAGAKEAHNDTEAPDKAKDNGDSGESAPRRYLMSSELPSYTSTQINDFMERNASSKNLIDSCQNILGRTFNVAEASTIVKILDYYKLTPDYIMLVCQHAADKYKGSFSIRLIEKEIANNFDNGILTYQELEEHYKNEAVARSLEGKFRNLLGIGTRALSKKEKGCLEKWVSWGYGFEVFDLAFEITVNKADKFNIGYMDAIIARWHDSGCTTLEDAENAVKAYDNESKKKRSKKKKEDKDSGSFDTNDFWEQALSRSYGD